MRSAKMHPRVSQRRNPLTTPTQSRSTTRARHPLPCIYFLPLILLLTILNKSLLTPPSTTFVHVAGFSDTHFDAKPPAARHPHMQVKMLHNIRIHPLSEVLHKLIVSHNQTSLVAFPCEEHVSITHPLLQLLKRTGHLTAFRFICQDPDSRNLAEAHSMLLNTLPDYIATFRRGNFTKKQITADVLLNGGVDTDNIRSLLLKAAGAGIRFALLHSAPMPGLSWTGMEDPITEFKRVYREAPFPFAHALVGVSRAYGYGEQLTLVYELTYLPKVEGGTDLTKVQIARDLIRSKMRK